MSGSRPLRRLRGVILRLTHSRRAALIVGLLLAAPGATLAWGDFSVSPAMAAGIGLILIATGAAFVLTAIIGRRPDWIDHDRTGD